MSSEVQVQHADLVRPNNPKHPLARKTMLSTLGHFAWFVGYRTRFLFFRQPQGSKSFDELVQHLKTSLGKVLVDFYPVAGRLIVRDDGRMELDQQGQGIYFCQARAPGLKLHDLGDAVFDGIPMDVLLQLAQTGKFDLQWPWPADAPLFFIQVTQFSCGGICISIRFSHQLLDGTSGWHFFQSWAETCRGENLTLKPNLVDLPLPIVPPPTGNQELENFPFLKIFKRRSLCSSEDPLAGKDLVTKSFRFTKEFIAGYKHRNPGFSTFQLLTSLLWHKITVARDYLDPQESSTLHFAVNCRGRMGFMPRDYLGQGAVIISATMSVESLRASSQNAAKVLKETIQSFTGDRAASYFRLVEKFAGDEENAIFPRGNGKRNDVNVGSSFYFPVYEDFGFGKPDGMTIFPTPSDGRLYYFPGPVQGSVVVYATASSTSMQKVNFV